MTTKKQTNKQMWEPQKLILSFLFKTSYGTNIFKENKLRILPFCSFRWFWFLIGGGRRKGKQNKSLGHYGINGFLQILALYNFVSQT